MEAEKAKEKVEMMPQELDKSQRRVEELTTELLEEKELGTNLQINLEKCERENETLKEVIDKFYNIRQHFLENFPDASWEEKCDCLLNDSDEIWRFGDDEDSSNSNYIVSFNYRGVPANPAWECSIDYMTWFKEHSHPIVQNPERASAVSRTGSRVATQSTHREREKGVWKAIIERLRLMRDRLIDSLPQCQCRDVSIAEINREIAEIEASSGHY